MRAERRRGSMHDCLRWHHRDVYGVHFPVPIAQEHIIEVGERMVDSWRESSCPSDQFSVDYDSALSPALLFIQHAYMYSSCMISLAQRIDHPGGSASESRRRCPTSR
jgi:hypothetical protein